MKIVIISYLDLKIFKTFSIFKKCLMNKIFIIIYIYSPKSIFIF